MMKKALKVTFGAIIAVGAISNAQAHLDSILSQTTVSVTGTYTRASNNGLSFGEVFLANGDEGWSGRHVFVRPDYEFDYGLGIMYHFPCTNTRLYFDYDHFNQHDDGFEATGLRNIDVNSEFDGDDEITDLSVGHGGVRHRTREVALGLSHLWEQNPRFLVDFRAQLAWDKYYREFKEDMFVREEGEGIELGFRTTENKVRGFGPGVGLMAHAKPLADCPQWGLFAGGMASLFHGKNEFRAFAEQVDDDGDVELTYAHDPENSYSIVGKLDVKFGIDYHNHFTMDGCNVGFGVALGMRYMNVFNAFKNGNSYYNPVTPDGDDDFATNTGFPNDFGRVGPFLQVSFGGSHH